MISSAEELLHLLSYQYKSAQGGQNKNSWKKNSGSSENAYDQIVKQINLQTDEGQQVEGNMLISLFGGNRFFSFDNHSIEGIAQRKYIGNEAISMIVECREQNCNLCFPCRIR